MYCPHCGQHIDDRAVICPKCGIPVSGKKTTNPNDASSFGWAFLGFIFPLIGLILFLVWHSEYPLRANSCIKGAVSCIIVGICAAFIYACVVIYMVASISDAISELFLLAL